MAEQIDNASAEEIQRIVEGLDVSAFTRGDVSAFTRGEGGYPATVSEIIRDDIKYRASAVQALETFKAANPWEGRIAERKAKMLALISDLGRAYGRGIPTLCFVNVKRGRHTGNGNYNVANRTITLENKLSVVTLLHEFAHSLGKGERKAVEWSVNLFRKIFPEKYGTLTHDRHMVVKDWTGIPRRRRRIEAQTTANTTTEAGEVNSKLR